VIADQLAGLIDFAELGGAHWHSESETDFAFVTGDVDDLIFFEAGSYTVRKRERGELSGPLIVTDELEILDRFLSDRYRDGARDARDLPSVVLPVSSELLSGTFPPPFTVVGFPANTTVEWTDATGAHVVRCLDRFSAAGIAIYGMLTAAQIRAAALDPNGGGLYRLRTTPVR
jgi:hypothetical protein